MLTASPTQLTDYSTIYIGEPDIPAGFTIGDYRRSRSNRIAWWRPLLRWRG